MRALLRRQRSRRRRRRRGHRHRAQGHRRVDISRVVLGPRRRVVGVSRARGRFFDPRTRVPFVRVVVALASAFDRDG